MALTVGTPEYWVKPSARGKKVGLVQLTFDSSYASGGYALDYGQIAGLDSEVEAVWEVGINAAGDGYFTQWDSENKKIKVYDQDAAEAASSASLGSISCYVMFVGN